jgi:hypothetical protein
VLDRPWLITGSLDRRSNASSKKAVEVFPEFVGASYMRRYELFCRKLILERHYTSAAFITSDRIQGENGEYKIPAEDLSLQKFARTLVAHVSSFG